MKVQVCTLGSGDLNTYEVPSSCTTGELQGHIYHHSGVAPDYQELRHTLPDGSLMRLCHTQFPLAQLIHGTENEDERCPLSLDLLYKLEGGDEEEEYDDDEYGPSPDHILCCCGVRSLPGEKLVCCLTVGCGVREGKPLCELCFASFTCSLM